jgi:hypothetical protein
MNVSSVDLNAVSINKGRRDALLAPRAPPPQPPPPEPEPVIEAGVIAENNDAIVQQPAPEAVHEESLLSWALGEVPNEAPIEEAGHETEEVVEEENQEVGIEEAEKQEESPQYEKARSLRFAVQEREDSDKDDEERDSDARERRLMEEESRNTSPERSETFKRLTNGIAWPKGASFMIRAKDSGSRELAISKTFKDSSRVAIHEAILGKTEVVLEAEKKVLKKLLYVSQGRLDHYTEDAMQVRVALDRPSRSRPSDPLPSPCRLATS